MPETSRFDFTYQGTRLGVPYDVRGDGPAVLFLPAFSTVSSRLEMHDLASRLACRAVITDWPGFGGDAPRLEQTPALHLAFLRAFVADRFHEPVPVVAAGHASAYALAVSRDSRAPWSAIALLAPTWRGPLPTMMGGYRPLQTRLHRLIDAPVIGHALYRLNVARPVIAAMYRRHVYTEAATLTPARLAERAGIARRRNGRFGSGAFVTGGLDLVRDRAAFAALLSPPAAPTLIVHGPDTPPKSRAEMAAMAGQPGITAMALARGSLGLHEEQAEAVAAALRPLLSTVMRPAA